MWGEERKSEGTMERLRKKGDVKDLMTDGERAERWRNW